MAQRIKIQQFDNGIKLIFNIRKDGMAETLQGGEVIFKMKHTTEGISITRKCTITNANVGECEYILTREDLSVVGGYITELETRFANGVVLSQDNPIILTITPEQIEYESGGRVKKNK